MGLCGNFNGDINDDTLTPNGEDNKNITEFVYEWQTSAECAIETSTYRGACSRSSQFEAYAKDVCSILRSNVGK